ncbi:MAG TPA: MarC family protein [Bacteroidales bacterium]|nr:MarC family protein [Bacteroidales bacterium]
MDFNIVDILSIFMVLFAIIDIPGSIPIIIDIKSKSGDINATQITLVSFGIMVAFLFAGESLLNLFGVDISSFAIAGSLVIFLLSMEMVLGVQLFKNQDVKGSSIVPVAFPLIAGAGSLTTLLSLKAQYNTENILIGLILNMVVCFFALKATSIFERILGKTGTHILRKVFGIILLAIAIKLFTTNTGIHFHN